MLDVLKFVGAPGSIPFLLVSLLGCLALVRFTKKLRRVGVASLVAVSAIYLILGVPVVAHRIARALPDGDLRTVDRSAPISMLVIFDGDNRRGRVREIQRVLREAPPATVWVLGSHWILEALDEAGVSTSTFHHDGRPATTREQMDQLADLVKAAPEHQAAVVASRLQAPRVAALIRTRAIRAAVLPSPVDREPPAAGLVAYVPSYIALRVSRDAIYEHAAIAFYRWRGWIA